jgi:hypothetical protein
MLSNQQIMERFGGDMARAVAFGRGERDFRRGRYDCRYREEQLQADYRDGYHSDQLHHVM